MLDEAKGYVTSHIFTILQREGHERDEGYITKHEEENWAEELSECCQGLALARLIFNGADASTVAFVNKYFGSHMALTDVTSGFQMRESYEIADDPSSPLAYPEKLEEELQIGRAHV